MTKKKRYQPVLIERPREEIAPIFYEHLDALETNCNIYDSGKRHFAAEIAVNLRVLLFDNKDNGNRSLLHQFGKGDCEFIDTEKTMNEGNPRFSISPAEGLVFSQVVNFLGDNIEFWYPNFADVLGSNVMRRKFNEWWELPIFCSDSGSIFTRKRIIRSVANQDRGGHVADKLESEYFGITRENKIGHKMQILSGDYVSDPTTTFRESDIIPLNDCEGGKRMFQALVRQIAHETLLTLLLDTKNYLSNLPTPHPSPHPIMFTQFHLADPKY